MKIMEKQKIYPICKVGSQSIGADWEGCREKVQFPTIAPDSHGPWRSLKAPCPSASSWNRNKHNWEMIDSSSQESLIYTIQ